MPATRPTILRPDWTACRPKARQPIPPPDHTPIAPASAPVIVAGGVVEIAGAAADQAAPLVTVVIPAATVRDPTTAAHDPTVRRMVHRVRISGIESRLEV